MIALGYCALIWIKCLPWEMRVHFDSYLNLLNDP